MANAPRMRRNIPELPRENPQRKRRSCLWCDRLFMSEGSHHRWDWKIRRARS